MSQPKVLASMKTQHHALKTRWGSRAPYFHIPSAESFAGTECGAVVAAGPVAPAPERVGAARSETTEASGSLPCASDPGRTTATESESRPGGAAIDGAGALMP